MTTIYDVAVLGAGVAGSAAAKSLASQGWNTVLLDRQRFPRHKVCGEFLSPESQETLSRLGLLDAVHALSPSVITSTSLYLESGGVIRLPLPGAALGISRYRLDACFHQEAAAAGACIREGVTVLSAELQDGRYSLTLRSGGQTEVLRARAVIAAWGGAGLAGELLAGRDLSGERRGVGIAPFVRREAVRQSPQVPGLVGVKMHYRIADSAPHSVQENNAVELYFFRGGYAGLNRVEDGKVNIAALLNRGDIPAKSRSVSAMLEEAVSRHSALQERIAGLVALPDTAAAVSPVRISMRPVAWSGFPLIGDAVCRIPPLCGDGMSMALRSAELCSASADRYLRGELLLGDWEREYKAAIMREFSKPLRWGRFAESLLSSALLSRALPALARLAPRAARGMIQATRLHVR
ncbi:NAD(P)/FAD-dependent oxidoreductase [Paenibacillus sp. 1011MAR3C5]|uniref:NAD(P)/FAD-dependent oxidoreductase n=1 Tax=Paenibacillus sp. 1011MAR3C5 TaxID=1675787 RepID=UPI000E6D3A55|nr:FAD-dependent monooxygenase [Paenibacillus sp. 1011MAR3C5]RJE87549.1 NAD(P)/FAD-dependent oxidoreductase [Paenibacillus sp. 1011MAR3C5]